MTPLHTPSSVDCGRWLARAAAAVALVAGCVLVSASPAAAELVDPPGSCVGTGAWSEGGFAVDSSSADPSEVIEIPRSDSVAWTGLVNGPEPGDPRPIAGSIALQLPAPLGYVTVRDWSGTGINISSSGTQSYELPSVVPAGVVFTLRGQHLENGAVFCSGTAQLRIAGGVFDSPLIWIALAGTVLLGVLLLLTGRAGDGGRRAGRAVLAALLGLLFGTFLGLTLLLFGLVPLESLVLSLLPLLLLFGGIGWAIWAPLGGGAPTPPAPTTPAEPTPTASTEPEPTSTEPTASTEPTTST